MVSQVTEPLTTSPTSRYGEIGFAGYLDDNGASWWYPEIGGQVVFANGRGEYTEWRVPVLDHDVHAQWQQQALQPAIDDLVQAAISHGGIIEVNPHHYYFNSEFDLDRFLALDVWETNMLRLYEQFNRIAGREMANREEAFYAPAFTGTRIARSFTMDDTYDCFLQTPINSLAGITRVRWNKAYWQALNISMGFAPKIGPLRWKRFYKLFNGKEKYVTSDDILNYLASFGNNPLEYVGNLSSLTKLIRRVMTLKAYEITRQAIDLPDWESNREFVSIVRNVSDEQVNKNFEIISNNWQRGQILVPEGDLTTVDTINILPLMEVTPAFATGFVDGFDFGIYGADPKVSICQVTDFRQAGVNPFLHWVEPVRVINDVANASFVNINRVFGHIHSATLEKEAILRISMIYPVDTYREKPLTMGMKLEKRHWPIHFEDIAVTTPIWSTPYDNVHDLFNQASWLGPKHWMVDLNTIGILPETEVYEVPPEPDM